MKKYLLNQKGVIPVIYVLGAVALLILVGFALKNYKNTTSNQKATFIASDSANIATPSATASVITPVQSVLPKVTKASTPAPTQKPSTTPIPTASSTNSNSTSSDNSCSYELSGPTGAVQVNIKPKSGSVVGDQMVELQAKSGCKVLDGRSSDKQSLIARAGGNGYSSQNSVNFSTVPAGHYSVRIQYKGQWTGYSDVDAVATQLKTVEFSVDGENPSATPTPTPVAKSTCQVNIASKSSESAPATVTLAAGASMGGGGNKYITAVQWDYNGDGNWDTEMSSSYQAPISREYSQPGTYTVKAKVKLSDEEITDPCSASFSLN